MKKFVVGLLVTVSASALVAALVVREAGPSTVELDADIRSVRASIASAEADMARFAGGSVLVQAEMRLLTLRATEAMLEQKRTSFLRGIRLEFRDGDPATPPPTEAMTQLAEGIRRAEAEAVEAAAEAARYSGGLIQVMALLREQTAKTTGAMLRQQEAALRLGLPIRVNTEGPLAPAPQAPGRRVTDREAL